MKITKEWLQEKQACGEGTEWFLAQTEAEHDKVIKGLIKDGQYDWANWTITKIMTHQQNVQYACYAAKQSLHLFEKLYPKDKRPRLAIVAANRWAKNPTEENRSAVWSAASAARSAAWSAARSAESAVWSAESAAWSAARSAESAVWSAESAAWSAAYKKILKYGLRLTKHTK